MNTELPPNRDEPLILGPDVLRKPRPSDAPAIPPPAPELYRPSPADLRVARRTENECIYFDEKHAASWIIYPPRSVYSFVQRSAADVTVIEYRRWTPMTPSTYHQLTVLAGCEEHGAECPSTVSLSVAVKDGYDPFR
jgi:hypothetical protein